MRGIPKVNWEELLGGGLPPSVLLGFFSSASVSSTAQVCSGWYLSR